MPVQVREDATCNYTAICTKHPLESKQQPDILTDSVYEGKHGSKCKPVVLGRVLDVLLDCGFAVGPKLWFVHVVLQATNNLSSAMTDILAEFGNLRSAVLLHVILEVNVLRHDHLCVKQHCTAVVLQQCSPANP